MKEISAVNISLEKACFKTPLFLRAYRGGIRQAAAKPLLKRFAEEYGSDEIGQQAIDQLPWGHIITLIYEVSDKTERSFYINGTIQNGWSKNILSMQIETNLYNHFFKSDG